jgi:cell division protein FtsW
MLKSIKERRLIWSLFFLACLLSIIGLIFIYSASSVYALTRHQSPHYFVQKQGAGLITGLVACFICAVVPTIWWWHLTPFIFIASLIGTLLTLVPACAVAVHGSQRWLSLFGFMGQPSELLKIGAILFAARFLTKHQLDMRSWIRLYIPYLLIIGILCIALLLQPDFGLAVTLGLTMLLLLFLAGGSVAYLSALGAGFGLASLVLIAIKPYRMRRIFTFLNPWADPKGAGFQIIQSFIAIGSGGFWGLGIGQSKQKFFYLPMHHTDFIFSIISEEMGFVGMMMLLLLFVAFLYLGVKAAITRKHIFTFLVISGFTLLIILQALINILVVTGLLPTKGIGLPFISYGKSSLIIHLTMIGIIMRMIRQDL